ncbi:MAG: hypothetical protein ACI4MJ_04645 [Aristaeellaceae bacterium]
MSEMTNDTFNVPPEQDFNTESFQGSMQQVLQDNVGNYVIVEFLIGTNQLVTRQGLLYSVASQFLVLYDEIESRYVVCDIFAVKFVTFLLPGYRPGQVPNNGSEPSAYPDADAPATTASARAMPLTPSQAAYAHATRHTRR